MRSYQVKHSIGPISQSSRLDFIRGSIYDLMMTTGQALSLFLETDSRVILHRCMHEAFFKKGNYF